ncbi:MAG: hypothetical protein H0X29_09400 [Parachlamydiaceae bacterium]|nr:hypothetical protein [Parachlamydiaceae bacterium]
MRVDSTNPDYSKITNSPPVYVHVFNLEKGNLQSSGKYSKPTKFTLRDMQDPAIKEIFNLAKLKGLTAFEGADGRVLGTARFGTLMRESQQAGKSTTVKKRSPINTEEIIRKNKITPREPNANINTRESTDSSIAKVPKEQDIDEEPNIANEDIEDITNSDVSERNLEEDFQEISDEEYEKIWTQFNKIINPEKSSDKEEKEITTETAITVMPDRKTKTTANRIFSNNKANFTFNKAGSKALDDAENIAASEETRFTASVRKDELATEKLRRHIKADLFKTEIKTEEAKELTIASLEISKAALKKMLAHHEISEVAVEALLNSANIDEKFLTHMLKEDLINLDTYNIFIDELYKQNSS